MRRISASERSDGGRQTPPQLPGDRKLEGSAFEQLSENPSSTGFNLGSSYNFDEHNHLLFSASKGLQNAAERNGVSTYIGYQYTL